MATLILWDYLVHLGNESICLGRDMNLVQYLLLIKMVCQFQFTMNIIRPL